MYSLFTDTSTRVGVSSTVSYSGACDADYFCTLFPLLIQHLEKKNFSVFHLYLVIIINLR